MPRRFAGRLLLIMLLAFSTAVRAQTEPKLEWVRLKSTIVELEAGKHRIDLSDVVARTRAIRLEVTSGSVELARLVVAYGNGQVHYEDRPIALKAGERTPAIGEREEERVAGEVTLEPPAGAMAQSAVVEVWGQMISAAEAAAVTPPTYPTPPPAEPPTIPATPGRQGQVEVMLAEVTKPGSGAQRIDIGQMPGRYRGIRVYLLGAAAVEIASIDIRYADGAVFTEDRGRPIRLDARDVRTRIIGPASGNGPERYIDEIVIHYGPAASENARVRVTGVASSAGARATRASGPAATMPTAPTPTTAMPGAVMAGGDVLFGTQTIGFDVDSDVIKVGQEYGKFDKIRLRVLDNDIFINEMRVVYAIGEPDVLTIGANIPANSRSQWFHLSGDRFIKEIRLAYKSRPNFKGLARVEAYGEYAEGWFGGRAMGEAFSHGANRGWLYLGGQQPQFFSVGKGLGYETDVIAVARNSGFDQLRLDVKDRSITLNKVTVVYNDGTTEVIPVSQRVESGNSFGPVDLKQKPVREIQVSYRSRIFDAKASGRSPAFVEFWAGSRAPKPAYSSVALTFATNRQREDDVVKGGRRLASFGPRSGGEMHYGSSRITVPNEPATSGTLSRALALLRTAEDPSREPTVADRKEQAREKVIEAWRAASANAAEFKGHALVFIHGFNNSFDDALMRAAQIAQGLKFDGPVIVYSWPSRGVVRDPRDYNYDKDEATRAIDLVRSFLEMVAAESGASKINVVAHSMGNFVLLNVLREVAKIRAAGGHTTDLKLHEVVLAAPDIDRAQFEALIENIIELANGFTLYASGSDRALQLSQSLAGGRQRIGDLSSGVPTIVKGVDTIDISQAGDDLFGINHATFANHPHLLRDMALLFGEGKRPPHKRGQIFEEAGEANHRWWRYRK